MHWINRRAKLKREERYNIFGRISKEGLRSSEVVRPDSLNNFSLNNFRSYKWYRKVFGTIFKYHVLTKNVIEREKERVN